MTIAMGRTIALAEEAERHCISEPVSNHTRSSNTGLAPGVSLPTEDQDWLEGEGAKGIIRNQLCLSCNEELPSEQQMKQNGEGWWCAVPILKRICQNEKVTAAAELTDPYTE